MFLVAPVDQPDPSLRWIPLFRPLPPDQPVLLLPLFLPRPSFVLATMAAAGIVLTVASYHLTPLGRDAATAMRQPRHLRSPIVLQAMRVQNPTPSGGCPAGFTKLSAPGQSPGC